MLVEVDDEVLLALQLPGELLRVDVGEAPLLRVGVDLVDHLQVVRIF